VVAEPVTVVLTRRVRPGAEQAFQAVLGRLSTAAQRHRGFEDVTVLRPEPGGRSAYAIVVHFRSAPELAAWLASPERALLLAEADQYCDGDLAMQQTSGVAGWFTLPGAELVKPPPKIKMAVTTWLGLVPLLLPLNLYLAPRLTAIPAVPRLVAAALVMTLLMTYAVMPALTQLLHRWLWPR
jgi:antibiotic biosynthesis monooxygenase (ABM) superfamily enzyme